MCGGLKQSCELRGPVRTDVVRCRGRWAFLSEDPIVVRWATIPSQLLLLHFRTFYTLHRRDLVGFLRMFLFVNVLVRQSSKTDGISLFFRSSAHCSLLTAPPPYPFHYCACVFSLPVLAYFHPPLLVWPLVSWSLPLCPSLSS